MARAACIAALAMLAALPPGMTAAETVTIVPVPPSSPPPLTGSMPSRAIGGSHDCRAFFPMLSARLGEEGKVLIRYDVDIDGMIRNVTVGKSSGSDRLDNAAVACVSTVWRNAPALVDGKPVASPGHQAIIEFRLQTDTADDYLARGLGREVRGDYQGAIADFSIAITLAPDSAGAYRARGAAYDATGQHDLARADYAKAAALTPSKGN